MKTVAKIIELFGGLEALRQNPIGLETPPYMRLVIEHIGEGPRGLPSISVAHYYEQNGDLMRDPEMVFEVSPDDWNTGEWSLVLYRQDNLALYQEAVFVHEKRVQVRSKLVLDFKAFARQWDRNIAQQGFLKVALGKGGHQ
jgi:hypothetical protein